MNLNIIADAIESVENTCAHFVVGHGEDEFTCALGHELKEATKTECMPCCPRKFNNRQPWDCSDIRFPTNEEATIKIRALVTDTRRKAFVIQTTMEDLMLKGLPIEAHSSTFKCPLCLHGTITYTKDEAVEKSAKTRIVCSTEKCMDTEGNIVKIDEEDYNRFRQALGDNEENYG